MAMNQCLNCVAFINKKRRNRHKTLKKLLIFIFISIFSFTLGVCLAVVYYKADLFPVFSIRSASGNLAELEPYIQYVGNVLDETTLVLPEELQENIESIEISNIEGTISYSVTFMGKAFNVAGSLTWEANPEKTYTIKEYSNVRKSIINHYQVDVSNGFDENSTEFKCKNDIYDISCQLTEEGKIAIKIAYNINNYDKNYVSCYAAINILKDRLKNPESLQIHEVSYASDVICMECEDAIGVKIDYSAQNSFGGYNREDYHILIDPNKYDYVESFVGAATVMELRELHKLSIEEPNSLKKEYDSNMETVLVNETLSKKINQVNHSLKI